MSVTDTATWLNALDGVCNCENKIKNYIKNLLRQRQNIGGASNLIDPKIIMESKNRSKNLARIGIKSIQRDLAKSLDPNIS